MNFDDARPHADGGDYGIGNTGTIGGQMDFDDAKLHADGGDYGSGAVDKNMDAHMEDNSKEYELADNSQPLNVLAHA